MKTNPNFFEIRIWYSAGPGDECFVAQVLDIPGIMAHGDTREEAARETRAALTLALDTSAEAGNTPPAPKNHAAVALGARGGMHAPRESDWQTGVMVRVAAVRAKRSLHAERGVFQFLEGSGGESGRRLPRRLAVSQPDGVK